MIICLEEKDKQLIEDSGMTVIEAKRIIYKTAGVLAPVFKRLYEVCKEMSTEQMKARLGKDEEEYHD